MNFTLRYAWRSNVSLLNAFKEIFKMIKIRMARGGRTHKPVYTIVATDSKTPRDGRFLEKLGQYDPSSTEVLKDVKVESVKNWINKGAKMSDTVRSLFKKHNIQL